MRRALRPLTLGFALLSALLAPQYAAAASGLPAIRHVFVIVEENQGVSTTFGPNSPAPYLSKTLRSQGAYIPNYYGTGHESNDNYIAMISGQAPNPQNQGDCQIFSDFTPDMIGSYGQAMGTGCIFPTDVKTIADQLSAAGMTWRDYNDGMGATPSREAAECGHPGVNQADGTQSATATDQYATRHNPFVYFHAIIDDTALCDSHVVNLDLLPQDLASAASTPNYVFITPNLCNDGHDATCANPAQPGGFAGIDSFLKTWVPKITSSPAFKDENGLLAIIFDEAGSSDTSSCCGEIPGPNSPSPGINGPGGGDTGAVL
ncbi:MAG TPA: alkaline phosphatase family protein, partial [Solirubrobacteraceae bacterium]|nr:alkaline phosphatase family protein [Solirubrobacteraceae bacterium]